MKQISIIIPTYNMEDYLRDCLESVLISEYLDKIEIVVVNDGSNDASLSIAKNYQAEFPDTVKVIDKPNGNYGSAINAGLPVAQGRYVKILDADDTFNSKEFASFVNRLETIDADVVHTQFTIIHKRNIREKVKYDTMGREPYVYGKKYALDEIIGDGYIRFFLMHALTYRRELLVNNGYRQTEGISYTDNEWATIPFFYAGSIIFLNLDIYQYNVCRSGQTMDPDVIFRQCEQLCTVTDNIIARFYDFDHSRLSDTRLDFLRILIWNKIHFIYRCFLQDMPRKQFDASRFESIFNKYESFCKREGINAELIPINKIMRTDNVAYWRRHHNRFPVWYEAIINLLNRISLSVYRIIIRR